jgi:hypothetical protein
MTGMAKIASLEMSSPSLAKAFQFTPTLGLGPELLVLSFLLES